MKEKGFTLLELSIVIVIIGLIVAGISAGQSLVRQASLRSTVSELESLTTSINSFKLQYDALPGDMDNATSYWPSTCTDSGSNTCNGNNDGLINSALFTTDNNEVSRFFHHLFLADIIAKQIAITTSTDCQAEVTVPAAAIPNGAYFAPIHFPADARRALGLTNNETVDGCGKAGQVVTTAETYNIDVKIDDGLARAGNVWANHSDCYSGNTYELNTTAINCSMFFLYRY